MGQMHLAERPDQLTAIERALEEDPLCRRILLFLLTHEAAMDTTRGIAAWWVQADELAVQAALDRLLACGAVTARTFLSGTLYALTANADVRARLRARRADLAREPRAA